MLYCKECARIIKPYDIWFLYDNKNFYHRRLELGVCPKCKRDICLLIETRKADGKIFTDFKRGQYAITLLDTAITQLWYRQKDTFAKKGRPYGFIYGENKEHKKDNQVVVYACDFFGNKELLSTRKNMQNGEQVSPLL